MSDTVRPRRILAVLAALMLPAATCGVAPALQDLLRRVERLERFAANAQLPLLLMDEHDMVLGTVLEYNDMFLYRSIQGPSYDYDRPYALPDSRALATVQFPLPGRAPLILEADRKALLAPTRGWGEFFYFESPDCTGTPHAGPWYSPGDTAFTRAYIGPPGKTLYALAPGASTQWVSLQSYLIQRGIEDETRSPCYRWNYITQMFPFEPVADLTQYTPPFRVVDQRELWGF